MKLGCCVRKRGVEDTSMLFRFWVEFRIFGASSCIVGRAGVTLVEVSALVSPTRVH